jgi:hypothetical protein
MLLTMKEMRFIATVTEPDGEKQYCAKQDLTEQQKEKLLEIDELNVLTYGEHLISNDKELYQHIK